MMVIFILRIGHAITGEFGLANWEQASDGHGKKCMIPLTMCLKMSHRKTKYNFALFEMVFHLIYRGHETQKTGELCSKKLMREVVLIFP